MTSIVHHTSTLLTSLRSLRSLITYIIHIYSLINSGYFSEASNVKVAISTPTISMDEAITKSWRFQAAQSPGVLVNHKKKLSLSDGQQMVNRDVLMSGDLKRHCHPHSESEGVLKNRSPTIQFTPSGGKSFILVVEAEIAQSLS